MLCSFWGWNSREILRFRAVDSGFAGMNDGRFGLVSGDMSHVTTIVIIVSI